MFSRAIVSSFLYVLKINRRGIGGNGFSLGCRLLYPLSYKEPLFDGPEAGFEPVRPID